MPRQATNSIRSRIADCLLRDQARFRGRLSRAERAGRRGNSEIDRLDADIRALIERREARRRARPELRFPADLPIVEHREAIADAVRGNPVVVVCGETGSGKSTQLPKICLAAGRGDAGCIGHTQPRRIAARSIAGRIAEEMGQKLGDAVGYKVRFSDRARADSLVKVMTDGILLAETQGDRLLHDYDTIIIDEAHERSLNIDFLLGYLKQLLPKRPDLRVVITSATIDPARLSEHFDGAPVIEVSGRMHPVDVRNRPLESDDPDARDLDMQQGILAAVDEVAEASRGDVLIFLSGEREIRETAKALRRHHPAGTEILPLYARLSTSEQHRVFEPHTRRRLILATNVAETSLTVPGIGAVVDPGFARISRYSARSKVQRLPIEPISQASAKQRAGRCGRLGPGVCIRLYSSEDFEKREPFTEPEILRTNLASVILRMAALDLGDVGAFPFVEPPRRAMIRDGEQTLHELGAMDDRGRLTPLGRRLAGLPIDPRIGRMLIAAEEEDCLREVLIIAAVLSSQDPRDRPMDRRDAADQAHAGFADESSDFVTFLNIWSFYHDQKKHMSWNKLRGACREHFLSFTRMREWVDVHRQLLDILTQGGARVNKVPADLERVHVALLAGLLGNVGHRDEDRSFAGARGSTFHVFPGSSLFKKPPKWVMSAEIVETTRRYARCVAGIRPEWIERVGGHLLKRSYSDPHWDERAGRVVAFEKASLWGLPVVTRRRVHYGPIDPAAAREIFIHSALVEGEYGADASFLAHNRALVESIRDIEAKRRRRDVLVETELRYAFYEKRVPPGIHNSRKFEEWRRKAERKTPDLLRMTRADLTVPGAAGADPDQFPAQLAIGELSLPLTYRHDPGADDDGVTVEAPIELLNRITPERLEWIVPGLLEEKIVALVRALPKELRRNFVPVPDVAASCLGELRKATGALTAALAGALYRVRGVRVPPEAWNSEQLPAHLVMRVRVIDAGGSELAAGRSLDELRAALGEQARSSFAQLAGEGFDRDGITTWDFGDLPECVEVSRGAAAVVGHPGLVDSGDSVALKLFDTVEAAGDATRGGLRRLFTLRCGDELAAQLEHLPGFDEIVLSAASRAERDEILDGIVALTADRAFLGGEEEVRTEDVFVRRLEAGRDKLWRESGEVVDLVEAIFGAHHEVQLKMASLDKPVWSAALADVRAHLERLMPRGFLAATPEPRLRQFPRYLRAVASRLDRLRHAGFEKDRRKADEMATLWAQYAERKSEDDARGVRDPALEDYRWLIEEYRVSLFAQEIGTDVPVSPKRLAEQWGRIGR